MDLAALLSKAPTLSGKLVTLRNIDVDIDTEPFFTMFLDPDMHLWTGNTVPATPEDSCRELERYRDLPGLISWTVVATETEDFVGTYWVAPLLEGSKRVVTAEAQRIAKPYWRRGYTREARRLVYDFLFTELQVEEVHAQAWEANTSSCRSMEQAGFRLRHTEERLFAKRQTVMPECHYVLDKDTWLGA